MIKILSMSSKNKFQIEFPIRSSLRILFNQISTPSGLSEWFADNVNSRGEEFTFIWDDGEEYAKLINKKSNEKVRFRWINGDPEQDDYYFEFEILVDEITKDVSLIIHDFSDENELEESKMLWDTLVSDLKQVLGSV